MAYNIETQDFTGEDLTSGAPITDIIIVGNCFSQEKPDTQVFPEGSKNITFKRCNLSNVKLPPGSIVDGCQTTRFRAQSVEGEEIDQDWELDELDNPVRPLDHKAWTRDGKSIDPKQYTFVEKPPVEVPK